MKLKKELKIAVLMGGVSNERAVSFKSGRAIAKALEQRGHQVIPFDVRDRKLNGLQNINPDLAFIALHGKFGEDGGIQTLLEERGIPYTGSASEASRIGMDKLASKRAFVRNAVPTPDYTVLQPPVDQDEAEKLAANIGYPLVCKPTTGGSSIGVSIVRSEEDLAEAIAASREASDHDPAGPILLEQHIHGRELTVGILDGEPLPAIEIRSDRSFFDYDAKYKDENTHYILPVALLESIYRKTLDIAKRSWDALGCRHFARTDIIYGYDARLYVLEVNTIPGFTERSLLPMAASHAGYEFNDLCERIAEMAFHDAQHQPKTHVKRKKQTA
ncbi:MAG: D-alanine--D-alanine ligase [Planctomycetes bacterium]|nr:D-alanine--D-alanine ligase [Planctomycetota bacterium]